MIIKSTKIPVYHFAAHCTCCDWVEYAASNYDVSRVRRLAKKHVSQTGHKVHCEMASAIIYEPSK